MKVVPSWKTIASMINKKSLYLVLEKRPKKYMFGVANYGDIPKYINPADGDPWDVIIPGKKTLPLGKKFRIRNIYGMIHMKNGNHKLIVSVYNNKCDIDAMKNQLVRYAKLYQKQTHIPARFVKISKVH